MKRITLGLMAALLLTGSAVAQTAHYNNLSFTQAQNLLSGYNVTFHGTYKETNGTDTRDLPDVVVPVMGDVSQYESSGSSEPHIGDAPNGSKGRWWNDKCQTYADVNADCVAQLDGPTTGVTVRFVTVQTGTDTQDGGTEDVAICIRNDVTDIDFDFHGFDITIDTSTSDGSC